MPTETDREQDQELDRELDRERSHLVASRVALRRMRERAEAQFATGEGVAGDAYTAETLGATLARRVAALADDPDVPLFFGRLDLDPGEGVYKTAGRDTGEVHYIGRRHVTDDDREPMVLDWRAPACAPFYQASAADPQGVVVRRRFGFTGGELTGYEDERLRRGEELGTASRILTAEIERPRVGPMRDIVATIQPDQDALVRADLDTTVCVQGAPGTGKTAVGLHRAAYLLYAYRNRLRRSGVLVVGPNQAFLRYIEAVLPALGEVDVQQSTLDELVARAPVRAVDPEPVAALKHDHRLAVVLHRALWDRLPEPDGALVVPDGSHRWRLDAETLARLVAGVRADRTLPYAAGRERLQARIVALLQRQAEVRRAESPGDGWLRRVARSAPVRMFLDAAWPTVTPESLVHDLLADPELRARAAAGVLSESEQELLGWRRPPAPRAPPGGARRTRCCWTRRPACWPGCRASATWWWTRRRTCPRCSCARPPGAAATAR